VFVCQICFLKNKTKNKIIERAEKMRIKQNDSELSGKTEKGT
jgi:hypothetical protein